MIGLLSLPRVKRVPPRDLPDFLARPLPDLALNFAMRTHRLTHCISFGKRRTNDNWKDKKIFARKEQFLDRSQRVEMVEEEKEFVRDILCVWCCLILPSRWKSTTLGLDIQEEFDGIQLNFRSGLQAWASRRAVIAALIRPRPFLARIIFTWVIRPLQTRRREGGEKKNFLHS